MNLFSVWIAALPAVLALAALAWALCTARRNAGLVDIFWPLFFLAAAAMYTGHAAWTSRAGVTLLLLAAWSLRLAAHLAARNWSAPEDRRYAAMRARHEPGFVWKSVVLVFALQGVLAWAISAPIAAALVAPRGWGPTDTLGAVLALFGIAYEAIADAQLVRFRADPFNRDRVMDRGLWRYSRHPNYFGEACTWWGFGLLGLAAGVPWVLLAPLAMTVLLLRVSGVTLLERDIGKRRPGYARYQAATNAFLPGIPRRR